MTSSKRVEQSGELDQILDLATDFAAELSETLEGTFGTDEHVLVSSISPGNHKVTIGPPQEKYGLRLYIEGEHQLSLMVFYSLTLSTNKEFLAIEESNFRVFAADRAKFRGPVVTFDFHRNMMSDDVPAAHLNVHVSNDSALYALAVAGRTKRTRNRRELE